MNTKTHLKEVATLSIIIAFFLGAPIKAEELKEDISILFNASGETFKFNKEDCLKSEGGSLRLVFKPGIKVIKSEKSDKKTISFSGTQKDPAMISKCLAPAQPIEISIKIFPLSDGEKDQTVISLGNCDLRYSSEKEEISLIVGLDEGYTTVKAPCKIGQWNQVMAKIVDNSLSLTVDGNEVKADFPAGKDLNKLQMYPRVGGTPHKTRPYKGYIDNISIKMKSRAITKK